MTNMPSRLDIATRIHQLLLRDLGHGIDIEQMLRQERYARDVLLVCDAHRGGELAMLAQRYRKAPPFDDVPGIGRTPQRTDWSRNTSGFGVSRPMDTLDPPQERRAGAVPARPTARVEATPPVKPSLTQRLVSRWWQR